MSQCYDSYFLEQECLQIILDILKNLTGSKVYSYLPSKDKVQLQNMIFFNILGIAQLKSQSSLDQGSTMCDIVEICGNMIMNCNQADRTIQNDMIVQLVSYKDKMQTFDYTNSVSGAPKLRVQLQKTIQLFLSSVIAPQRADKFMLQPN